MLVHGCPRDDPDPCSDGPTAQQHPPRHRPSHSLQQHFTPYQHEFIHFHACLLLSAHLVGGNYSEKDSD